MVKYFPILIKDISKKIRRQEDGRNHPQPIRIEDQQTATAMSWRSTPQHMAAGKILPTDAETVIHQHRGKWLESRRTIEPQSPVAGSS
ncbi:uncharacterized protein QC761_0017810 [Podospora bellae-mahoneyi]|uniref:Uncharacterized protein n=1 Tax=Podospora bellae-mahoneyi TaxID=2093777 RepID=A0ABR0G069_9PEZI|nr:hypothetical protein QC761_0017810 [Podospora bellae-mahoneyi]